MAEEAAATAEVQAGSNNKMMLMLFAVNMVLVVLFGAAMLYFLVLKGDEPAKAEETAEDGVETPVMEQGIFLPIDTFITNLYVRKGQVHYLKVSITLECENKDAVEEIKERLPQIRNSIILLLASKTVKEISGSDGMAALQEEIRGHLNKFLSKGKVIRVCFTEFVVQ